MIYKLGALCSIAMFIVLVAVVLKLRKQNKQKVEHIHNEIRKMKGENIEDE